MKQATRKISLLLFALLLFQAVFGAAALAQTAPEEPSAVLSADDSVFSGERIRIELELTGYEDPTIDYIVKKPGRNSYVYLKKDTSLTGINYKVTTEGEFSVKAIVAEADGSKELTTDAVTFTVLEALPEDAATAEVLAAWQEESDWETLDDLPGVSIFVNNAEAAARVIELGILQHLDSYMVFAYSAKEYFYDIGDLLQHTAFLKDGMVYYSIGSVGNMPYSNFTVYPIYDEAGVIVRHLLYGDALDSTMSYRDGKNQLVRVEVDATDFYEELVDFLSVILTKDMTPYERVTAIHNAITTSFRYDMESYDEEKGRYDLESYSAKGLFENGVGVCEGYAELFETLCLMSGVPCTSVTGSFRGQNHMWNMVKLDGVWYHVDVTSDDPVPDQGDKIIDTYFLRSDEFMNESHTWKDGIWPEAPQDYSVVEQETKEPAESEKEEKGDSANGEKNKEETAG